MKELEFSKEKSQDVANMLMPFIQMVDTVLPMLDLEYAKEALTRLEERASTVAGASIIFDACGADGSAEAQDAKDRTEFMEALLKVFEIRKKQWKNALKRAENEGQKKEVLKQLGL